MKNVSNVIRIRLSDSVKEKYGVNVDGFVIAGDFVFVEKNGKTLPMPLTTVDNFELIKRFCNS